MDLWIRNQDKTELIPITCKLKIYEGDLIQTSINTYKTERHFNILHGTDFLGEYKSKERALEVLTDIEDHIGFLNVEMGAGRFGELDFQTDIVYEMPKE